MSDKPGRLPSGLLARLSRRGVLRVGASYALIAWLLLQIGDVVLDPFDFGDAAMRVLLIVVALGFPVALTLAWFYELTPTGVARDRQKEDERRPTVGGMRRYADLVVIGVLVLIVALLLAERGGMIGEALKPPVVAVLPFANMSPEAEDAYFGEGVADTLIHKLGQLDELVVLSSQSTFQFKGRDLDLDEVGARLGATNIMTGSVQRSGNVLRVNARLMDVDSGRQLWGNSFDRQTSDVFAIQDEIAAAAVEAMQVVLTPQSRDRITESATTSLSAYDAYVLGKARLASRTPQDRRRALDYFRAAVEQDPGYALAYAGLTEALYLLPSGPFEPDRLQNIRSEAAASAQAAIRIAPELGDAWLAQALSALLTAWDYVDKPEMTDAELAEIAGMFERAIELSPNHGLAHKYYANFCSQVTSRSVCDTEPLTILMRAAQLDPRSGIIKVNVAENLVRKGREEEAKRWLLESLTTQEPFFRMGNVALGFFQLGHGEPVEVALRNRAYVRERPAEYASYFLWLTALMDLGAWETASETIELMMDHNGNRPMNYERLGMPLTWRLFQTVFQHRMARATGQWETAEALAREQMAYYKEHAPSWPQLLGLVMPEQVPATLARVDLRKGEAQKALERYGVAFPERSKDVTRVGTSTGGVFDLADPLDPLLMRAALLKQAGELSKAERMLRVLLAVLEDEEVSVKPARIGWSRFIALALLGESDSALTEFERIAGTHYHHRWYDLETYAFDLDYAAILSDPRYAAAFDRIRARAERMREEYLASD